MDFLLFMLFSVFETIALYYLTFALFRFELNPILIVFASMIASYISFTMREVYHLASLDVLLQLFLMFAFIWLLFRVHAFYAGVMAIMGFVAYVGLQILLYYLFGEFGLFSGVPGPSGLNIYILQIVTGSFAVLIGWLLYYKKLGFSFIPDGYWRNFKWKRANRLLFLLYIPAIIPLALLYFLLQMQSDHVVLAIPIFLGFVLMALLYWAYRKDFSND